MIVYGDRAFEIRIEQACADLAKRARSLATIDDLRTLLVLAGQLEQGILDAFGPRDPRSCRAHEVTMIAAKMLRAKAIDPTISARLDRLGPCEGTVRIKVPEGYAFYALYPEQYFTAAAAWARAMEQRGVERGRCLVVGVRSIGTSLAAAVAAAIEERGWDPIVATVRPTGHPFDHRADDFDPEPARCALVVDEGPGLSGSSMAAVARRLMARGFAENSIAFLPGHPHDPGPEGSDEVRAIWRRIERFTSKLEPAGAEEIGGGSWRRFSYRDRASWPAVAAFFERPKYALMVRGRPHVFLRFAGHAWVSDRLLTGEEEERANAIALYESGWGPRPLGTAGGFVATEWIAGRPLALADLDQPLLSLMIGYLSSRVGPSMSNVDAEDALDRLVSMAVHNARELGIDMKDDLQALAEASAAEKDSLASHLDGRLMPHRWIRTREARVYKIAPAPHADHSVVGKQRFAWDVAGLAVEWNLSRDRIAHLLGTLRERIGPATFAFHRAAYAAFRAGVVSHARRFERSAEERERLDRACDFYRRALARSRRAPA